MAVGSDVTLYSMPSVLNPLYGNNPVSYRVFFRIRPGKMNMDNMRMSAPGTIDGNTHDTHNMGTMKDMNHSQH